MPSCAQHALNVASAAAAASRAAPGRSSDGSQLSAPGQGWDSGLEARLGLGSGVRLEARLGLGSGVRLGLKFRAGLGLLTVEPVGVVGLDRPRGEQLDRGIAPVAVEVA